MVALLGSCATACGSTATLAHVSASAIGAGGLAVPASPWPEADYDARRSSGTSSVGPSSARVRWTRSLGAGVGQGLVIGVDGIILQASDDGVLHGINPPSGQDNWTFSAGAAYTVRGADGVQLSTSPAVLRGGTILWPGPRDTLYALNENGGLLWSLRLPGQPLSPAIGADGRIYVADQSGRLTALQVTSTSHRTLWTLELGGRDDASPTIAPDGTIYSASGSDLVAVRDEGAAAMVVRRFAAGAPVETPAAVAPDGTVVLGAGGGAGIDAAGTRLWSLAGRPAAAGPNPGYSAATVRPDGIAYLGDDHGRVTAVRAATGATVYTSQAVAQAIAPAITTTVVVDSRGDAYFATSSGHIYGLDPQGRRMFELDAGAPILASPVISGDQTLYVATTAGTLYAIGGTELSSPATGSS